MVTITWPRVRIAKRQKLVLLSIGLTVLMAGSLIFSWPLWSGLLLVGLAWVGLAYCFEWDLKAEEWLLIPLPLLMAVSGAFGWLRLYSVTPWLVTVGCLAFGIAVYGLLLTLNIINLSRVKTLPLARTATSVLSMASLTVGFLWYYLWLYYQPAYIVWVTGAILISLAVAWPIIWIALTGKMVVWRSLAWLGLLGLIMGQLAALVGLWPRSFMTSLFLAGSLYLVLGVIHYQEKRQVNKIMNRQYTVVFGIMLVALYVFTSWYGGI